MHYSKDALQKMAQEAAERFLTQGDPMTETIAKTAASRDLTREQVARVCAYANHSVNAELMKKQAYTTFELADPDAIWPKDKEGGFYVVPDPTPKEEIDFFSTKVASAGGPVLETFLEVASAYGVSPVLMGDDRQDVLNLIKAADLVSQAALDSFEKSAAAMADDLEQVYSEIKEALLSGVPVEQLIADLKEDGLYQQLQQLWPRLEAEALVPPSRYDDAGPYSMQRAYKQASTFGGGYIDGDNYIDFLEESDADMVNKGIDRYKGLGASVSTADLGKDSRGRNVTRIVATLPVIKAQSIPEFEEGVTYAKKNPDAFKHLKSASYRRQDLQNASRAASGIDWGRNTFFKGAADRITDLEEQAALDAGVLLLCDKIASVFASEDFAKEGTRYRTMMEGIEKRAFTPLDRAVFGGLGKLVAAPIKGVLRMGGSGLKGIGKSIQGQVKYRWDLHNFRKLPFEVRSKMKTIPQPPPPGAVTRMGKWVYNHPGMSTAGVFAGMEMPGALREVNAVPRLVGIGP